MTKKKPVSDPAAPSPADPQSEGVFEGFQSHQAWIENQQSQGNTVYTKDATYWGHQEPSYDPLDLTDEGKWQAFVNEDNPSRNAEELRGLIATFRSSPELEPSTWYDANEIQAETFRKLYACAVKLAGTDTLPPCPSDVELKTVPGRVNGCTSLLGWLESKTPIVDSMEVLKVQVAESETPHEQVIDQLIETGPMTIAGFCNVAGAHPHDTRQMLKEKGIEDIDALDNGQFLFDWKAMWTAVVDHYGGQKEKKERIRRITYSFALKYNKENHKKAWPLLAEKLQRLGITLPE